MSANLPQQWLDRASEDLTVARLVLSEGHASHACFLAQQCIEKSLKAYLLTKTGHCPRTHKLVDLLAACESCASAFARFRDSCIIVDQYYIPVRYPNGVPGGLPGGLPDKNEAEETINIATDIFQFACKALTDD
jgi:HEPN domain-containing protein